MRKTKLVEIEAKGRDFGKAFLITEMSAFATERWATKAIFALMNSGADFSELDGKPMTMQTFASVGITALAKIKYELAEPLIAEMMTCVKIIPDPNNVKVVRDIIEEDIGEAMTLMTLKKEVWGLHIDFFIPAAPLTSVPEDLKTGG